MKNYIFILLIFVSISSYSDENILMGMGRPAYGITLKMNFPSYTGAWARGYKIANETGENKFIEFGTMGLCNNGSSSVNYSYIGTGHSNSYMVFKPDGKIGIATYSPKSILDVNGSIKLKGGNQNFSISDIDDAHRKFGEFLQYGGIAINGDDGSNRQMYMFTDGVGTANIFTIASSEDSGSNWRARFVVKQNGGVGIGTTKTNGYKLAVDGTIGAREINVNTDTWSDFVFDSDYDLKTLEEVEAYIEDNSHLPDIPSEVEVKEKGIDVGKMNAKLLQKIEELTLYLIEQNKRVKSLETQINKQNIVIQELKQR
jgi:hypothetical protein